MAAMQLLALAFALASLPGSALAIPAFPGCEGFGCETPGGRKGRVIAVTSLADSGPGTLRAALEARGPRTVVLRVAGIVTLERPIVVSSGFLTVAGQTAPGSGLLVRNKTASPYGLAADSFTSLEIRADDVVIRHLAIRPGVWPAVPGCTRMNALRHPQGWGTCIDANDVQAISIRGRRIVLDHVSLSHGTDELIDVDGRSSDVALLDSIVSHGYRSFPYCGFATRCVMYRGMGIITGDLATGQPDRVTLAGALWAHLMARAPQVAAKTADVRGNLTYDWRDYAVDVNNLLGPVRANIASNVFLPGPETTAAARTQAFELHDWNEEPRVRVAKAPIGLHLADLVGAGTIACTRWVAPGWTPCTANQYAASPIPTPAPPPADQVVERVLSGAGASLRLGATGQLEPRRDSIDQQLVAEVRARTGRSPSHTDPVPWPKPESGAPYADGDGDGLADEYERLHGLDPGAADGAGDRDGDGFTNLEEFLNGTPP